MKYILRRDNRFYRTATDAITLYEGEWVYADRALVGPVRLAYMLKRAVGRTWWVRSKREGYAPLVPTVRGRKALVQAAAAFYGFVRQVTLDGTDAATEREKMRRAQAARGLARALLAERYAR